MLVLGQLLNCSTKSNFFIAYMKNKFIINIIRSLVIAGLLIQPIFVVAGIPEAVNYLETQVDDAWITMALAASGQTDIPSGHLRQVSGTAATDYAKTILALAAKNENPATYGNVDYIDQLKNKYDGTQIGDVNLLNDDMWAILALASVDESDSTLVLNTKSYLLSQQNDDGGWSYSLGAGSDTNDTAAAVMALIEAGVTASDPVIVEALDYIKSAQNADGGIGYQPGSASDAGSDAWAISALIKAGVDPASWRQGNNHPVSHLESLQDDDGGYWWVAQGTSEWNNKAMTAYAVIALSGKSYPVGYYQTAGDNEQEFHLRLEGSTDTICDIEVAGVTALDLVKNAAGECGYTYNISQESFGPYLRTINDDTAQGLSGWLYFVNNVSPVVGAADYVLSESDEVLWYFGEWGWPPTRVAVNQTEIDPGQTVTVSAQYFNGTDWLPLPQAMIKMNDQQQVANGGGQLVLTIPESGVYQIYVEMPEYVRSDKVKVTVGDAVSQNVGLQVTIDQGGGGSIGGDAIALVVNPTQINFGTLEPGGSSSQTLTLTNEGSVNLNIGAAVTGDAVFKEGLEIDGEDYDQYDVDLASSASRSAAVTLTVPADYLASGVKSGELIFWATSQ